MVWRVYASSALSLWKLVSHANGYYLWGQRGGRESRGFHGFDFTSSFDISIPRCLTRDRSCSILIYVVNMPLSFVKTRNSIYSFIRLVTCNENVKNVWFACCIFPLKLTNVILHVMRILKTSYVLYYIFQLNQINVILRVMKMLKTYDTRLKSKPWNRMQILLVHLLL